MTQTNSQSKASFAPQLSVPATYMRGGTSKGTFFKLSDLPERCQVAGESRDKFLLRVIGSPDPYGKQIDGLGNGSSSTSKTVIFCVYKDGWDACANEGRFDAISL